MLRCWAVVPAAEKTNALVAMDTTVDVRLVTLCIPCINRRHVDESTY
jgi:hypothetical protein